MDYHVAFAPRNDEVVNWITTSLSLLVMTKWKTGLPRRFTPRNDGMGCKLPRKSKIFRNDSLEY